MPESPSDASVTPQPDEQPGTAEAIESAVEGVPMALSLAPGAVVPVLGGELVLAPGSAVEGDRTGTTGAVGPAAQGAPGTPTGERGGGSVVAGIRDAGPLAVAGLVANGAAVVVTVLMARFLPVRGYGALVQLTGLFLIISMPGSAVIVGVVRRVTITKGAGSKREVWRWARRCHRQGTLAVVAFGIVLLLTRNAIARALSLPDAVGVVAILLAGGIWILLSLDRGLLQAHRNYRTLSVNLMVEGVMKLVAMLVLVFAGFGVAGAAFGILLAEITAATHARITADRAWAREAREERASQRLPTGDGTGGPPTREANGHRDGRSAESGPTRVGEWLLALQRDRATTTDPAERRVLVLDLCAALLAMALLALLQNIDVIVFGRLAPHQSGSYAAISVASKALIFGAVALGGYLLPEAAIRWRQGGHALHQLATTLILLAVPAVAILVVAAAFPHLMLSIVFSPRYLGAQAAFAPLALAMVFLSVTVVLTMYLLAVGWRWIGLLLLAGGASLTVGVVLAGGVATTTAYVDLGVQAVLAGSVVVAFARVHRPRVPLWRSRMPFSRTG